MPYIPNTDKDRKEMLKRIGMDAFEQLLSEIPEQLRLKGEYNIKDALSELEVLKELEGIARKNKTGREYVSFLGGGLYDHYIPSVVNVIAGRSEFYTAYTPYQAEVSQGTLQAIFEFQSMICELFDMDVSNASMYDGATALAEAALMAVSTQRKQEVLMLDTIHPHYQRTIETYMRGVSGGVKRISCTDQGSVDPETIEQSIGDETAAVLVQHPNFFGILEHMDEIARIVHDRGALLIMCVHPLSLGMLQPPGHYHADIAVGEGQPLGIAQSFGGPLLGLFTAKKEYIRRMPGRIIAETVDAEGKRGFVMTLQTREQHIRREKATSNICTNEGLCALMAAVYLSLLGRQGIKEVAELMYAKAHYLAKEIEKVDGFQLRYRESLFFNEFVVSTEKPAADVLQQMEGKGFWGGYHLRSMRDEWKHQILVAVTEKRTKKDMDGFVAALRELSG